MRTCLRLPSSAHGNDVYHRRHTHTHGTCLAVPIYDNSVDIYTFGILFWYICANDTKLPGTFDACQKKQGATMGKNNMRTRKVGGGNARKIQSGAGAFA